MTTNQKRSNRTPRATRRGPDREQLTVVTAPGCGCLVLDDEWCRTCGCCGARGTEWAGCCQCVGGPLVAVGALRVTRELKR